MVASYTTFENNGRKSDVTVELADNGGWAGHLAYASRESIFVLMLSYLPVCSADTDDTYTPFPSMNIPGYYPIRMNMDATIEEKPRTIQRVIRCHQRICRTMACLGRPVWTQSLGVFTLKLDSGDWIRGWLLGVCHTAEEKGWIWTAGMKNRRCNGCIIVDCQK